MSYSPDQVLFPNANPSQVGPSKEIKNGALVDEYDNVEGGAPTDGHQSDAESGNEGNNEA